MAWYLCTVSRAERGNWARCKGVGLWGVPRGPKVHTQVQVGDHLLFWIGRVGYVGYGVVSGPPRRPKSREEAPWPGGKYRFETVVPFTLQIETQTPIHVPFKGAVQNETGFTTVMFQRGFSPVSDSSASRITSLILDQELRLENLSGEA